MRMGMSMFMRMVVSHLHAYFHEHAYGDADVNGNVRLNGFPPLVQLCVTVSFSCESFNLNVD